MNKKLVVGNWKMNPATLEEAKKLAARFKSYSPKLLHTEAVICPPFPFISACSPKKSIKNFHMGAQSVSPNDIGARTGEVAVEMLKDLGIEYIVVGHSEERMRGDTDAIVAARLKKVLDNGLTAIVCVGEKNRDGEGKYLEDLKNQIRNSLADIPKKFAKDIIIAYEPVWAIGAKEAMKPEDTYETSIFVKKVFADAFTPDAGIKTMVLYGGSVNAKNAPDIISVGKVDGFLVGRESVSSVGFVELLKAVDATA